MAVAGVMASLPACGDAGNTAARASSELDTVAVGTLPEPLTVEQTLPPPVTTTGSATTTTVDESLPASVADLVVGNRVLLIGDSVLASTAPRHGGVLCDVLPSFGWQVEVDAEIGRDLGFANTVLDARIDPFGGTDWDVVGIFLGNNFDGDVEGFQTELDAILERVAPRPVLLYTLSEVDLHRVVMNRYIRDRPQYHPNVVIVEWAEATAADPELMLTGDGIHATEEGRASLVVFTAAALGEFTGGDGECLPPVFDDDSQTG